MRWLERRKAEGERRKAKGGGRSMVNDERINDQRSTINDIECRVR
jgi:hypothetical protein